MVSVLNRTVQYYNHAAGAVVGTSARGRRRTLDDSCRCTELEATLAEQGALLVAQHTALKEKDAALDAKDGLLAEQAFKLRRAMAELEAEMGEQIADDTRAEIFSKGVESWEDFLEEM